MEKIEQLSNYLKSKFLQGEVEGYELVVALVAMVKDSRIKESDVKPILVEVFKGNIEGMIRSLHRASQIIDDTLSNNIITDVRETLT